jgi:hypothetical protein
MPLHPLHLPLLTLLHLLLPLLLTLQHLPPHLLLLLPLLLTRSKSGRSVKKPAFGSAFCFSGDT